MPLQKALPTPSNPSGNGITIYGSTTINRPRAEVWKTLIDTASYHKWNTFTPRLVLSTPSPPPPAPPPLQVNDRGTLDVYISGHEPKPQAVQIQVSVIDAARFRLCWKAVGYPAWLLRGERVQEILELDGGKGCEFRSFETLEGGLARVVGWWFGGRLDGAFQRCAGDLKGFVEGGGGG